MKLNTYKKRWKWVLFSSASIIFFILIYYSHLIIRDIAEEERNKVAKWADAIKYRAAFVNHTDQFFETIRVEEGKRALIFAQALQKVIDASLTEDITFYMNIITSYSTIPSIIVGEQGKINYAVNIDSEIQNMKNIKELGDRILEYDSIIVPIDKHKYVIFYYKESKIYTDLRFVIDNLVRSYFQEVIINEASAPVIVVDETKKNVIAFGHIDTNLINNDIQKEKLIKEMKSHHDPIKIVLPNQGVCYVLYKESPVLKKLRYYPYILFFFIFIFVITAYLLFSFARKSEQNKVWVGMSKETAHQLGTPISSLLAWCELLRGQNIDASILNEIEKDVNRLETIAQRFSKIGSDPEHKEENLLVVLNEFISYLQTRISSKVHIKMNFGDWKEVVFPVNRYLFEWVIENICKNAVDAMDGTGVIIIEVSQDDRRIYIDISDTGKGIPPNLHKTIFKPGYTTKKRGWGLGLSLAKRIVEDYHKGKLFVKSSVLERGTVMRIALKKKRRMIKSS